MEEKENTKLYYSIGEVSRMFNVNASLVRYWEREFPGIIKPKKNRKGNRFFTKQDIDNFHLIYHLVKEQGMTLDGAKKKIKGNKEELNENFEIVKILKGIREMLNEIRDNL